MVIGLLGTTPIKTAQADEFHVCVSPDATVRQAKGQPTSGCRAISHVYRNGLVRLFTGERYQGLVWTLDRPIIVNGIVYRYATYRERYR